MSVNDWLVIAITLVAAVRRDTLMFCIMIATVAHTAADYAINMSGYSYYITAALVDAVAVFSIACMSPVSRSVKAVQALCAAFIAAHVFGLVWWFAYEPPFIYNTACSVIYAAMLAITFFKGGKKRVRADKSGQRTFLSRIAVHASSKVVREHEGSR